jgi:hypothetical protein
MHLLTVEKIFAFMIARVTTLAAELPPAENTAPPAPAETQGPEQPATPSPDSGQENGATPAPESSAPASSL